MNVDIVGSYHSGPQLSTHDDDDDDDDDDVLNDLLFLSWLFCTEQHVTGDLCALCYFYEINWKNYASTRPVSMRPFTST